MEATTEQKELLDQIEEFASCSTYKELFEVLVQHFEEEETHIPECSASETHAAAIDQIINKLKWCKFYTVRAGI